MAHRFNAQIHPIRMVALTPSERLHRLAALSTELYGDDWANGLSENMRVVPRQVRRWKNGETVVPKVVLVALGAMLEVCRLERAGIPI